MYAPVDDTVVCDAALQELMIMFRTEFAKNARTIAELDEAAKNMQEAAKKQEADFDEEIRIAKAQSEKEIQEAQEELSNAANNSSMFKKELLELDEALERAAEEDVKLQEADRAADLASRKQLDLLLGEKVKLAQQRAQLKQLKEAAISATRAELYDSMQIEGTLVVGLPNVSSWMPDATLIGT